jgi:hypothetical protein
MPREVLQLSPGKPEVIALKFAKGKDYGERVMFSTVDDRILYLDQEEARELEGMGIRTKVPFTITKLRGGGLEFSVLNGAAVKSAAPAVEKYVANDDSPFTPLTQKLCACFLSAIDAVAEAQAYSRRKDLGITFTSEDVRCVAISAFIEACR